MTSYTVVSTNPEAATVRVDGQLHRLPWDLLRACASQDDPSLRAVYADMLREAQAAERSRAADAQEYGARKALAQTLTGEPRYLDRLIGLATRYLRTPDGGWPETQQAWRDLTDACWMSPSEFPGGTKARRDAALAVAREWYPEALHPSRRES